MNAKGIFTSMIAALMLGAFACVQADAATILVKCEKRANRPKASVNSANLRPGLYRCRIRSGANVKITTLKRTVGNQLECDFDSNPNDIAAGATRIPANFIQGGQVTGKVLNPKGFTVTSDTSACRIR